MIATLALALAGLWVLSPIDWIPDLIPIIGPLHVPREVLLEAWPGDPRLLLRLLG